MPMKTSTRSVALGAIAAVYTALPLAAQAGVYQAICSTGNRCTVTIAGGKIISPSGVIKKQDILAWTQGGAGSKGDTGMKAVSLLGFGLLGLVAASGAKTHDYSFDISHIDKSGNVQITTIQFKNDSPANRMAMELIGMTGLTMGETNPELQSKIDSLKAEAAERERIANLECGKVLKRYDCNWNTYLDANPTVKAWAERFPEMAEKERIKQGAILN